MFFRLLLPVFFLFTTLLLNGQQVLWINELDSDTPGLDTEEFIELKSIAPFSALDDYIVVFFNGADRADNASYWVVSLEGYTTDINGLFVIGNAGVQPFPSIIIPDNTIQNGADGVAIYKMKSDDFPVGTPAFVDHTLIDVMIYGTNDPDAATLLDVFKAFNPNIKQLNEGNANNTNSIQRDNNGGFFVAKPTPRKNNDGSGIDLNGLRILYKNATYREGDTILLTFETETPVDDNLVISYSLDNGQFNGSDYIATNRLSILKGTRSITSSVIIVEDMNEEGDEDMLIYVDPLPTTYLLVNNNIKLRILDNDFVVSNFGTPVNPTYGKVTSTQQPGYYDRLDGLSGSALKQALQDIISDETVVRAQTYNDVVDILKEADQNPENSNQVWLLYTEQGRSKIDFQLTSENIGAWNREHVWPRSRGGFNSIEGDGEFDGVDIWWNTNADSLRHGNSDAHHLRAVDGPENSRRGNQFYGQYVGPAGTAGSFRGDVARSIFYMAVRYNGLEVVDGYPENQPGKFGDQTTLLEWHRTDRPDDFEVNRNNVVQSWQFNRNPFIDMPELVEYIYGNKKGEVWFNTVSTTDLQDKSIVFYPNPASKSIDISGLTSTFSLDVVNSQGQKVQSLWTDGNNIDISNLQPGIYLFSITMKDKKTISKQIIIQ